jgi:hypothetical protein
VLAHSFATVSEVNLFGDQRAFTVFEGAGLASRKG